MTKRTASSPAQSRRNQVAEAVRNRGQSPYNLWVLRPPFYSEDIIVNSDSKMELFYFLEGDPELDEIDYGPLSITKKSGPQEHFADVIRRGVPTRVLWAGDQLLPNESVSRNDLYVALTDLDGCRTRIDNWRRILPCIRRVVPYTTLGVERRVIEVVANGGPHSIARILDHLEGCPNAIAVGAIATLIRRRRLAADVEVRPWSLHTIVSQGRTA